MSHQSDLDSLLTLLETAESESEAALREPAAEPAKQADLSKRYLLQIDRGEGGSWDPLLSFDAALEALRACSECLEILKEAFRFPIDAEIPELSRAFRVQDTRLGTLIIWEDTQGALHWEGEEFEAQQAQCGKPNT